MRPGSGKTSSVSRSWCSPAATSPPACNLMAPIVMNPKNRLAKQVLQIESDYPSVFPLESR